MKTSFFFVKSIECVLVTPTLGIQKNEWMIFCSCSFFFSSSSSLINRQKKNNQSLLSLMMMIITQSIQCLYLIIDLLKNEEIIEILVQYYPTSSNESFFIAIEKDEEETHHIQLLLFSALFTLTEIHFNTFLLTRSEMRTAHRSAIILLSIRAKFFCYIRSLVIIIIKRINI